MSVGTAWVLDIDTLRSIMAAKAWLAHDLLSCHHLGMDYFLIAHYDLCHVGQQQGLSTGGCLVPILPTVPHVWLKSSPLTVLCQVILGLPHLLLPSVVQWL